MTVSIYRTCKYRNKVKLSDTVYWQCVATIYTITVSWFSCRCSCSSLHPLPQSTSPLLFRRSSYPSSSSSVGYEDLFTLIHYCKPSVRLHVTHVIVLLVHASPVTVSTHPCTPWLAENNAASRAIAIHGATKHICTLQLFRVSESPAVAADRMTWSLDGFSSFSVDFDFCDLSIRCQHCLAYKHTTTTSMQQRS